MSRLFPACGREIEPGNKQSYLCTIYDVIKQTSNYIAHSDTVCVIRSINRDLQHVAQIQSDTRYEFLWSTLSCKALLKVPIDTTNHTHYVWACNVIGCLFDNIIHSTKVALFVSGSISLPQAGKSLDITRLLQNSSGNNITHCCRLCYYLCYVLGRR